MQSVEVVQKGKNKKIEGPVCKICDEKLNKSSHILVKCPYCSFESCRKCCETYALNESIIKCMSPDCGREWTRKHIRESFSLNFINKKLKNQIGRAHV